jgi:hypothetical protein
MDWIALAQDKDRTLVNTVMNLQVLKARYFHTLPDLISISMFRSECVVPADHAQGLWVGTI